MKQTIKNLIRSFGLDVFKYIPIPLKQARAINKEQRGVAFLKMLVFKEIDLVFDVGANTGQFASHLLDIG